LVRAGGIDQGRSRYQPGIDAVDRYQRRAETAPIMRLCVLGPLVVDGEPNGLSPRDRAVLTALTLRRGEPVDTDTLAQVLWGDDAPPSGAKVVQGCVVRIRRRLGAHSIVTTPHGYRMTLSSDEIDVDVFARLLGRGKEGLELGEPERAAHALGQAIALWRGHPFADVPDWDPARIEAARLEEMKRELEELAIAADIGRGRHAEAVAAASARVAEAPLREHRWELLARAHYAAGRQVEALRTLQSARTFLADEAGIDPGPALAALEDAILAQDPTLQVVDPSPEPSAACPYLGMVPYGQADADVYFGRERDIAASLRQLSTEGVLAIVGASGSGKSSLVRAGIVPALHRQGKAVAVITPGVSPMRSLGGTVGVGEPPVLVVDQCEEIVTLGLPQETRTAFLDAIAAHAEVAAVIVVLRADALGELTGHRAFARLLERGLYLLGPMGESELRSAIVRPAEEVGLLVDPGLVEVLVREVEGEPSALPLLSHCLRQTWERREGRTMTLHGYLATGGINGAVAQTAEHLFADLDPGGQSILRSVVLRMVTLGPEGEPVVGPLSRRALPVDERHRAALESMINHRLFTSTDDSVHIAHEALVRAWPRLRSWLDDDVEGARILRHLALTAETWENMGRPDSELYRGGRLMAALDWLDRVQPELGDTEAEFLGQSRRLRDEEEAERTLHQERQARTNRQLRLLLGGAVVLLCVALVTGVLFLREADRATASAVTAEARRLSALAQVVADSDVALLMGVEAVRTADTVDTRSSLLQAILRSPELVATARTTEAATDLAVTPGGKVVVADFLSDIAIHDASTLTALPAAEWGGVAGRGAFRLAVRPGTGELAVATSYHTLTGVRDIDDSPSVVILDGATLGQSPLQLGGLPPQAAAFGFSFSGDGRYLAVGFEVFTATAPDPTHDVVMVWDLESPDEPVFAAEAGLVFEAVLSADGRRLHLATADEGYRVLNVETGEVLATIEPADTWGLLASPDGRLLASAAADSVLLVDAGSLESGAVEMVHRLAGFDSMVQHFAFSNDGSVVAAGDGESIRMWSTESGELVRVFDGPDRLVRFAFAADDSTLFAVGNNGVLTAHDLTGTRGFIPRTAGVDWRGQFLALASPDGSRVAFASWPEDSGGLRMEVADLGTGTSEGFDPGHGRWGDFAWSPDSRHIATVGADAQLRVWELSPSRIVAERRIGNSHVAAVDWSPDGSRIMVAERSGTVRLLDAVSLEEIGEMSIEVADGIVWAFLSPDNRTVAVIGGPPEFVVVDVIAGAELHRVELEAGGVWRAAFSPDGDTLMVGGGTGHVGFFDVARGDWHIPPLAVHKDMVFVEYSSSGTRAVSGGWDGLVVLWDPATGDRLGSVPVGPLLATPSFLPDDTTVLIPYFDGSTYLWDTRVDAWLDHACRIANRNFTPTEWTGLLGDALYRETCPNSE
jgi:WD40 repeat protein/DNA-binding SARP family transcriptional activator